MKIALMSFLLVAFSAVCYGTVVQIGMGLDVAGNHHLTGNTNSHNSDVDTGLSPCIEIMAQDTSILYGFGAEYQIQRKVEFRNNPGKIGFIPLYGVARYQIPINSGVKPELIGQVGYNFITADNEYKAGATLNGGIYWGLGGGLVIDRFVGQLLFKTNYGTWKYRNDTGSIINTEINLSAGVRF